MRSVLNLTLCFAVCLAATAGFASPYVEKAQTKTTPWSGYWWPLCHGGLVGPLAKYDQATGRKAVAWERCNRKIPAGLPQWFGFCHAWAASSVMEPEPRKSQNAACGDGQTVGLSVGDQKGLLAACHTIDVANVYGNRFMGKPDDDPLDIAPDALWRVLKLYVEKQRVPLVLDIEPGPEVWNFPVYAYRITLDGTGNGQHHGVLTLWMVDDGVPPDYLGSQVRRLCYTFTCSMRNGSVVLGSGRWTGRSQADHPDFAWYPYVARAENPEVTHQTVCAMIGQRPLAPASPPSVSEPSAESSAPPNTEPSGSSQPGVIARSRPLPGPDDQEEQPVLTPVELAALVANRTSAFNVDVTTDRFDGGSYRPGEPLAVHVQSQRAGYLYLFHLDKNGNLSLLFPNSGRPVRIAADTPADIPSGTDDFTFVAGDSPGLHRIKAVVTIRPIMMSGLVAGQQQQVQQQQQLQTAEQPMQLSGAQQAQAAQQKPPPLQEPVLPSHGNHQRLQQQRTQQSKSDGRSVVARAAVVEQTFRLPPAQQSQVQAILSQYAVQNTQQTVDGADVQQVIGQFAQDEVIFVVESVKPPAKPRQPHDQVQEQSQYQQSPQQQIVEPQQ